MKTLYLIDFSNFAYKFKSVYKFAHVDVSGVPVDTSVLYGFLKCLKYNIASDIVIVLDGVPTQSNKVLPGYKGQRQHDETPSHLQVPKLENIQFLTKIGSLLNKNIKVVCSPGQETDEVISSIVHHITNHLPPRASFISKLNTRSLSSDPILSYLDNKVTINTYIPNDYDSVVIGSTDGDFIQLQRWDGVFIDKSSSSKKVSHSVTSKSTSSLTPIASIAYKAIYGDVSDNIPANKLSFKKDDVLSLLNNNLKTDDDLISFYNSCKDGSSCGVLTALANYIHKHCLTGFLINWTVAFLTFRSYPIQLDYNDYDINKTIKRYRLKV